MMRYTVSVAPSDKAARSDYGASLTKHLNEMAAKGWYLHHIVGQGSPAELVGTAIVWFRTEESCSTCHGN